MIETELVPFRVFGDQPVRLFIRVTNPEREKRWIIVTVTTSEGLSLNRSGYKMREEYRLGPLKPRERKEVIVEIYRKPVAKEGDYPVEVKVEVCEDNYRYVVKEFRKMLRIPVVLR